MFKFITPIVTLLAVSLTLTACSENLTSVDSSSEVASTSESKPTSEIASKKPGTSTIVELAATTDTLSTLVEALTYSDDNCGTSYLDALGSTDYQFTVFAPTNDAFATLIADLGAGTVFSCDVLPVVLAYHVTKGRHWSGSVLAHKRFRMLSKEWAPVDASALTIAGAPLDPTMLDISASNGMVHLIGAVMLPPSITG